MNSKDKIIVEALLHELNTSINWKVGILQLVGIRFSPLMIFIKIKINEITNWIRFGIIVQLKYS